MHDDEAGPIHLCDIYKYHRFVLQLERLRLTLGSKVQDVLKLDESSAA